MRPAPPSPPLTLRDTIDAGAPLRPAQAIGFAIQILEALAVLHASGATHGGVSPERIRIRQGRVELAPALAPASVEARTREGATADVFAVGCVLYEMLTRTLPEVDAPRPSWRTPASLGAHLEAVVMRAIDPSPVARFSDARAMLHELRVCLVDALGTAARNREA